MKITLAPEERRTALKALGRAKRVTKLAMEGYKKAELETLTADVQIGHIDGAVTAIERAGEAEDVELLVLHRTVLRLGIRLLVGDVEQTKDRQAALDIGTNETDTRLDELERLGRRFGEQQELELTEAMLHLPRSSQVGEPAGAA